MKKHFKLTFLLTVLISMIGTTAFSHDFEVKNADGVTIYYLKISETEVAVSYRGDFYHSFNEYTGVVVIPKTVTYNGVTYSVTSIGFQAFCDCSGLTSITIPQSVTSIDWEAFEGCSGLTSITIPSSVTIIGGSAFKYCSGLTSITIPNSVTIIYDYTFYGCSSLTSITIPSSVTIINDYAFNGCSSLTSITIPSSVTSIGSFAFDDCHSLTTIKVSVSDYSAFCNNNILASIYKNNPILIDKKGNEIKKYDIPGDVTSIGSYAFAGCSGLTSITIPSSVTSIDYVFSGSYPNLRTIKVLVSDYSAFCNNEIVYKIASYIYNMNYYYDLDMYPILIDKKGNEIKKFDIPKGVTSIGGSAFMGCSGLTSITIPSSVTSIGYRALAGCSGLTSITIPNSVTSIGDYAFTSCSNLLTIVIGNGVISIGSRAFSDNPKINDVYCYTVRYPQTESNAFENSYPDYVTLHVPTESVKPYKGVVPWSSFKAVVPLTESDPKPTTVTPGDANGDGLVNVTDIVATVNYIMEKPVDSFNKEAADLSGDGVVNVTDIVMMVSIIMNGGNQ